VIERICAQCGLTYRTFPSQRPTYCSSRCVGLAKTRRIDAICVQCGVPFWHHASKPDRRYCSRSCATTARNLTDANPSLHRDVSGPKNPMFGRGLRGADNPMFGKRRELSARWKGGRKIRRDGYVLIAVPDDYPYPAYQKGSGTKYALEHRVVVEQRLGRYLLPGEVVHHIDGNPSNNAEGNLEVFASQSEHIRSAHGADPAFGIPSV
jgi:hypothetical protein